MNPHLTEQIATQHETEMRALAARGRAARRVQRAGRAPRRHPVRRRAGYALISIGLRLAYAAGED